MDQRDLLSHGTTRCILVFFENTMTSFNSKPSPARLRWFENFREYLNVNQLGYANSKKRGDYSEEIIFVKMKYLEPSVKSWLIEHALEMISTDMDFDLADVRITAKRISKALDIPESDFYDVMDSKTARFRTKTQHQSHQKNDIEKTYERMINEANDPNQSSFSLNNIVFMVFMALAITGLISMCS